MKGQQSKAMQQAQVWHEYWKNNSANTFASHYHLGDPIGKSIFAKLSTSIAEQSSILHILDLGSGKGDHFDFLASIFTPSTQVNITGVDYGISSSFAISDRFDIVKTDLCDLSLPKHDYDLVTSLYALEYAEPESAIASLKKVLKPHTSLLIVSHAVDSVITAKSKNSIAFYERLLIPQIDEMLSNTIDLPTKKDIEKKLLAHLTAIYKQIDSAQGYDLKIVADRIKGILIRAGNNQLDLLIDELRWYFQQLHFHKQRLILQVASANTAENKLAPLLEKESRVIANEPLMTEYGKIGNYCHCILKSDE